MSWSACPVRRSITPRRTHLGVRRRLSLPGCPHRDPHPDLRARRFHHRHSRRHQRRSGFYGHGQRNAQSRRDHRSRDGQRHGAGGRRLVDRRHHAFRREAAGHAAWLTRFLRRPQPCSWCGDDANGRRRQSRAQPAGLHRLWPARHDRCSTAPRWKAFVSAERTRPRTTTFPTSARLPRLPPRRSATLRRCRCPGCSASTSASRAATAIAETFTRITRASRCNRPTSTTSNWRAGLPAGPVSIAGTSIAWRNFTTSPLTSAAI